MPEVRVQPRVYEVTIWPEDMEGVSDATSFCVQVEYRGNGRWVLARGLGYGGSIYLTATGWHPRNPLYFDLETALEKAKDWAPRIELMGWTAEKCLAWHQAGCPLDWR